MRRGNWLGSVVTAAVVALAAGCGGAAGAPAVSAAPTPGASRAITVTSPAFAAGGTVPRRFTCDGANVSPPLRLSGVPGDAAELVVLAEDPDAPSGTFVHWLMWGVDPHRTTLAEGAVPKGAVQGRNGFGQRRYGGPCPPAGQSHHYVFSVLAADTRLHLPAGATVDAVRRALAGHTVGSGTLDGRYGRTG
ncbi:YbhB/YbcL family Raf kinase inhibitor-like protein [Streptomyces sp. NBC_00268]|uniref:YbhB/YbcL family Raf kinase inhibitor-like protein n=1 Tax=unclassified Streptomyces TaxID=2593676 RepID=UPI00224CE07C|nr:YbhB/YbcL family Raf kinase inhibitor-like protein [Streptomyces sp. NBC_00268]MCX5190268.1 YbhB/YbcL family Raf kinase inhibitor-like protein [Streptomyces sp. NBC_00268]